MEKTMVFTVILIALVVVAGVQTIQLVSLNNKLAEGGVVSASSSSTPVASSGGDSARVTAPSNIQNLPKMVGGC